MAKEKCPHCGSPLSIRRGYRKTGYGRKKLRKCSRCRRKFTPDDGFLRMRFSPRVIREAVKLYKKGNSSSEVKRMLRNRQGVEVSRWSIIKWFRKYGSKS